MSDVMTFPATFEEFAKTYKIVDTAQIYTNNTELIPIFRVKQWLEHKSTLNLTDKDKDIIKALEWCLIGKGQCSECPLTNIPLSKCRISLYRDILDLINRQQAENENLEYKLLGVMHFVDKWLDGAELEQDEVNRASAMREKTLRIIEKLQAEKKEIDKCEDCAGCTQWLCDCSNIKTQAIKEFAERLKNIYIKDKRYDRPNAHTLIDWLFANIDNLVKEMIGENK